MQQQYTPDTWEEDYAQCQREGKIFTPWGPADGIHEYAEGITFYTTSVHGGFYISPERNEFIPKEDRNLDGWYEEDCEAEKVLKAFPEFFVDAKAVPWIKMINAKSGLETVGSCGGHKHPKSIDQVKENEFYVQFRFNTSDHSPNEDGWNSLCDMMSYISECELNKNESLKIEFNTTIFGSPFFTMRGKNVSFEDIYGMEE